MGASELPVLRPNTAGIDIGATEIYVAVPTGYALGIEVTNAGGHPR
ncbi:MAG TPA: hypothetical protein VKV17_22100 [Bryobacteraceae bacterium]|nr:hypothetical protein [Bryobacteraceae bacterium]